MGISAGYSYFRKDKLENINFPGKEIRKLPFTSQGRGAKKGRREERGHSKFFSYNSYMKNIKFANFVVFIIFFGIALIEALQKKNWLGAGLFLALGVLSLWADFRKK